jgi:TolB-like protein
MRADDLVNSETVIRFGNFELDLGRCELRHTGVLIPVHSRPFRALTFLIEHRHRFLTNTELMAAIWPGTSVSDASLGTAIKEARIALRDNGRQQRWIKTARGFGYRFVGKITKFVVAAERTAIGILGFVDLTQQRTHGAMAESISGELIDSLSRVPELRISTYTSSFPFREMGRDFREIGRELGVDAVVNGSIQVMHERFWVTARLIHTESGHHLWSKTWDCSFNELLGLPEEIGISIKEAVQVSLLRELQPPPADDRHLYEFPVGALAYYH